MATKFNKALVEFPVRQPTSGPNGSSNPPRELPGESGPVHQQPISDVEAIPLFRPLPSPQFDVSPDINNPYSWVNWPSAMAIASTVPAYHPVPAAFPDHLQEPTPPSEVPEAGQTPCASPTYGLECLDTVDGATRADTPELTGVPELPDLGETGLPEVEETIRLVARVPPTAKRPNKRSFSKRA